MFTAAAGRGAAASRGLALPEPPGSRPVASPQQGRGRPERGGGRERQERQERPVTWSPRREAVARRAKQLRASALPRRPQVPQLRAEAFEAALLRSPSGPRQVRVRSPSGFEAGTSNLSLLSGENAKTSLGSREYEASCVNEPNQRSLQRSYIREDLRPE